MGLDLANCSAEVLEPVSLLVKSLSMILIVLTLTTFLGLGALFWRYKSSSALLRARSNLLTYIYILGSVFQICWAIDAFLGREGFPCLILNNLMLLIICTQIAPRIFTVVQVYFKFIINKQMAKFELVSTLKLRGDIQMDAETYQRLLGDDFPADDNEVPETTSCFQNYCCRWIGSCARSFDSMFASSRKERALRETLIISDRLVGVQSDQQNPVAMDLFPPQYVIYFASKRFAIELQLLLLLMGAVLFATSTLEETLCVSPCAKEQVLIDAVFVLTGLLAPVSSYYLYQVRNEPDPLGIVWELQMNLNVGLVLGIGTIIVQLTDPGNLEKEGHFRWALLWVLGSWLEVLISLGYPLYRVWVTEDFKKTKIDDVPLSKALESEVGRDKFKAFLIGELSVENYLFWTVSTNYNSSFKERTLEENSILKKTIINMYVREDAQFCVNISGAVRKPLLRSLENDPAANDFDEAAKQVLRNMESDSFARFRQTSEFKRIFIKDEELDA